ncbi:GNAT family N-acetyltransferase [Candidatus Zixiibacteriota bacterium]
MTASYITITAKEWPDLSARADELVPLCWPEFMRHDPWAGKYWGGLYQHFPEYQFALTTHEKEEVIAIGNSIPLAWDDDPRELPDEGWDWALQRAFADFAAGHPPDTLSAIQIIVTPKHRGQGLSSRMVREMKSIAQAQGLRSMIAPVRPSLKNRYPLIPMERYIHWRNENGLPFDPWMRVNAKLGAAIIKTCERSMRIAGTIAEWEEWTGMSFPESGEYIIPGALAPVTVDCSADRGTYIEPNVWMHHQIP